jgi:hypothetical protein
MAAWEELSVVDGGVCVLVEVVMAVVVERANARSKAIDICPVLAHGSREEKSDARAGYPPERAKVEVERKDAGDETAKSVRSSLSIAKTQICHRSCGVS